VTREVIRIGTRRSAAPSIAVAAPQGRPANLALILVNLPFAFVGGVLAVAATGGLVSLGVSPDADIDARRQLHFAGDLALHGLGERGDVPALDVRGHHPTSRSMPGCPGSGSCCCSRSSPGRPPT
jgi:hypothetical protein